jgi:chromosome segregation ATPase
VLYLAEVQKKGGMIRSGKVELKLLACQRSESNWSAVPNEEIIGAPDDCSSYNAGALVMLELSGTKQVQRHSEAGRQLVTILQNFSRLQDRSKSQEEEIEQWKESLTYQSQELNRREMEMEARQEQLQQMEEDFERLQQQRQELDALQASVEQQREEFERKSQDLEGAWAHLRGEMNRLEDQQAQYSQVAVLDEGKAQQMQDLLDRLSGAIAPTETVRENLNQSFAILTQQQDDLHGRQQAWEQERTEAQERQAALDTMAQQLQDSWQAWREAQASLEASRVELQTRQQALALKQAHVNLLTTQTQRQEELHHHFCQLAGTSDQFSLGGNVDVSALEAMPVNALETLTQDMGRDVEKVSQFVRSQEEELSAQKDDIEVLKVKMQEASDYDRMQLESDVADEQDRYRMLEETLVGQRRNIQERRDVLKRHQMVLARRKGEPIETNATEIDLSPVLNRLEEVRQDLTEQLRQVQGELQGLRESAEQQEQAVEHQVATVEELWTGMQQLEETIQSERSAVGELWGRLNVYQDASQVAMGSLPELQDKLNAVAELMGQFQEASDYQLQAIAEMRQTISSLTQSQSPEFAS